MNCDECQETGELRLSGDVLLHVSAPGHGPVSRSEWRQLTERAVAAWQGSCAQCVLPAVAVELWEQNDPAPVRHDGLSVVRVRSGEWCPDAARDRADCYDPARRAITHIYPDPATSEDSVTTFREADIEVNLAGLEGDAPHFSLKERVLATLVHEIGHVWGLQHSCLAPMHASCQAAEARQSVMYPNATEDERLLVLEPTIADLAQLASKYPRATPIWHRSLAFWGVTLGVILLVGWGVIWLRRRASVSRVG